MLDLRVDVETIVGAFARAARARGADVALLGRAEAGWLSLTWAECQERVEWLAAAAVQLGLEPGQRVALALRTRPEWLLLELGIQLAGGVTVPLYPDNPAQRQALQLQGTGASWLIGENGAELQALLEALAQLPGAPRLERLACLDAPGPPAWAATLEGGFVERALSENPGFVPSWSQLLALGRSQLQRHQAELGRRASALAPDGLATLLHTSGSLREPKAVRLSHANLLASARACSESRACWQQGAQLLLLALPQAHLMARLVAFSACDGVTALALEPQPERTVQSCAELRATTFASVPALFEKLHARLRGAPRGSLQAALGGRVSAVAAGGAPLAEHVHEWFWGQGLPILPCLGGTEMGFVAGAAPEHHRAGSVGRATRGTSLRIASDGELLVRGPSVMLGYLEAEHDHGAFELHAGERWFKSGDLARLDADGTLWVLGRKDNRFKTSGAGYISPEYLEQRLRAASPLISRALVYGAGRPHVVALLTLEQGLPGSGAGRAELGRQLADQIAACNASLSPHERIQRFCVLERELSAAEGELTDVGKPRRDVIFQKHRARIEALYAEAERAPA